MLYGWGLWHPRTITIVNIKDHQSQMMITNTVIIKKVWHIVKNYQNVTKRHWAKAVGKMAPIDLLSTGFPQTLCCKNKKSCICEAQNELCCTVCHIQRELSPVLIKRNDASIIYTFPVELTSFPFMFFEMTLGKILSPYLIL